MNKISMRYIKHFEDVQDELQDEVQDDAQSDNGELTGLIDALRTAMDQCIKTSDECSEMEDVDCDRFIEASKVTEATLWCVENESKHWPDLVPFCYKVVISTLDYSFEEDVKSCQEALDALRLECEEVIDGDV